MNINNKRRSGKYALANLHERHHGLTSPWITRGLVELGVEFVFVRVEWTLESRLITVGAEEHQQNPEPVLSRFGIFVLEVREENPWKDILTPKNEIAVHTIQLIHSGFAVLVEGTSRSRGMIQWAVGELKWQISSRS